MSHHHNHNGGCCGHEHHDDDDHLKPGEGEQNTLYGRIDKDGVIALNEATPGSAPQIIKPWDQRLDESSFVESGVDDQMIIRIPFIGAVKLRSIFIKAGPTDKTPAEVHVFANREELDFGGAESGHPQPEQKLTSIAIARECIEYPLKTAKFNSVRSVHLYIPRASGAETTSIYYIGFKGEWLGLQNREGPKNIVYESAPQVKDHAKIPGIDGATHSLGPGGQ